MTITTTQQQYPLILPSIGGGRKEVVLSPSALTFAWEGCKACWWHAYVAKDRKIRSTVFPPIFGKVDSAMKAAFVGQSATLLDPSLEGRVEKGRSVQSSPFSVEDYEGLSIAIQGRTDLLVRFADGTVGVPDAKTASVREEYLERYQRQLMAYALCLSAPAEGEREQVSMLGLIVYEPERFRVRGRTAALTGRLEWIELPIDWAGFSAFMAEVADVAIRDEAPESDPGCKVCRTLG